MLIYLANPTRGDFLSRHAFDTSYLDNRVLSSGANGGDFKNNDVIVSSAFFRFSWLAVIDRLQGITFDMSEVIPQLIFYRNGTQIKVLKGIRGEVYPAVRCRTNNLPTFSFRKGAYSRF